MMRRFGKRCGIGLRRQKIEPTINLKRIRVDNLRADFLRDICRQLGFTSRGGSDDEENSLSVVTVKPSLFKYHVERSRDISLLTMRDSSTSLGMTNSGYPNDEKCAGLYDLCSENKSRDVCIA